MSFSGLSASSILAIILYGSYVSISSGRLSAAQWRDLSVFGISTGSMYALIALGYTMVYGVLRFINFAHGEVFMVGAMMAFYVANALAVTPLWTSSPAVSLLIVLVAAMFTSTAIAVIIERIAYRPLRGAPRLIPLITSIGGLVHHPVPGPGAGGPRHQVVSTNGAIAGHLRVRWIRHPQDPAGGDRRRPGDDGRALPVRGEDKDRQVDASRGRGSWRPPH